jgi:hypothetical protein
MSSILLGLAFLATPAPVAEMPESLTRLPAEVRDAATIIVAGKYWQGRSPCEFLPDGSRRWALLRGFEIEAVFRGEVGTDYLGIDDQDLPTSLALEENVSYLLLLKPSEATLKMIQTGEGSRHPFQALLPSEVLAIVPR